MTKKEITEQLVKHHSNFTDYLLTLSDDDFNFSAKDKWSAGQHLDHIYRSVLPLNKILMAPAFILKMIWGKANRASRSYADLVTKYNTKLQAGGKAFGRFLPDQIPVASRQKLNQKVNAAVKRLGRQLNSFSEEQLDKVVIPHPLLGKVTLREMMYFTIHHVQHHQSLAERDLRLNKVV